MFFPLERDPKVLAADVSTLTADGGGDIPAATTPRLYKYVRVFSDGTAVETLYFRMASSDHVFRGGRYLAVAPYHTSVWSSSKKPALWNIDFADVKYLSVFWGEIYAANGGAKTAELYDPVLESALNIPPDEADNPVRAVEHARRADDACMLLQSGYVPAALVNRPISWGCYKSLNTLLLAWDRGRRESNCGVIDMQKTYIAHRVAERPCDAVVGGLPMPLLTPDGVPVLYSPKEMFDHIDPLRRNSPDDYVVRIAFGDSTPVPVSEMVIDRYGRRSQDVITQQPPTGVVSEFSPPDSLIQRLIGAIPRAAAPSRGVYAACRTVYDLAVKHSAAASKLTLDDIYVDVIKTFGEEMMFIVASRLSPDTPLFAIHIDFARLLLWPTNLQRIVRPEGKLPELMF